MDLMRVYQAADVLATKIRIRGARRHIAAQLDDGSYHWPAENAAKRTFELNFRCDHLLVWTFLSYYSIFCGRLLHVLMTM
jgi:hypothetical protein